MIQNCDSIPDSHTSFFSLQFPLFPLTSSPRIRTKGTRDWEYPVFFRSGRIILGDLRPATTTTFRSDNLNACRSRYHLRRRHDKDAGHGEQHHLRRANCPPSNALSLRLPHLPSPQGSLRSCRPAHFFFFFCLPIIHIHHTLHTY